MKFDNQISDCILLFLCILSSGEMAPVWFPYAEVVTGESDMDEMSLEGSSQSSYTQLHVKRSAPIVQRNPAHSLYSHLISYADDNAEDECITQQVVSNI